MIKLEVNQKTIQIEMRGDDELLLDELTACIMRILNALEKSDGNPLSENLTYLVLSLIKNQDLYSC